MKKPLLVFTAVLAIAALLSLSGVEVPLGPVLYWLLAFGVAIAAGLASRSRGEALLSMRREFLCDSCKYNDARYCARPERPNARSCPDWKPRG